MWAAISSLLSGFWTRAWETVETDGKKIVGQEGQNSIQSHEVFLTIIPRARMGYESIAHESEGRRGYWLRGYEGERNNCFSKIQLVGQKKYRH